MRQLCFCTPKRIIILELAFPPSSSPLTHSLALADVRGVLVEAEESVREVVRFVECARLFFNANFLRVKVTLLQF